MLLQIFMPFNISYCQPFQTNFFFSSPCHWWRIFLKNILKKSWASSGPLQVPQSIPSVWSWPKNKTLLLRWECSPHTQFVVWFLSDSEQEGTSSAYAQDSLGMGGDLVRCSKTSQASSSSTCSMNVRALEPQWYLHSNSNMLAKDRQIQSTNIPLCLLAGIFLFSYENLMAFL